MTTEELRYLARRLRTMRATDHLAGLDAHEWAALVEELVSHRAGGEFPPTGGTEP